MNPGCVTSAGGEVKRWRRKLGEDRVKGKAGEDNLGPGLLIVTA
jgi:hypothetical protein